jgi:hypothetical protein
VASDQGCQTASGRDDLAVSLMTRRNFGGRGLESPVSPRTH